MSWASVRKMGRHEDLQPSRYVWIDRALAGEPTPQGITVLTAAACEFALRPADGEQAEGQPVRGHGPRCQRRVSILDTGSALPECVSC
jgi:hypothetical protein